MKTNWKKSNLESSPYLQIKSKTRLKYWISELNFVSDLAQVREAKYIASWNIFSSKQSFEYLPWRFLFCHENNQF